MERLLEISRRVDEIGSCLNSMYPRFKADKEISSLVTELKEYAQTALKEIQGQISRGELTDFERHFIEPAIRECCAKGIDKMRKWAAPSARLNDLIWETDSTISYWLNSIEEAKEKVL